MKKKIAVLLLLCLGTIVCLCACHIEDTNGPDDYSLVEIDDEEILTKATTYTQNMASSRETNNSIEFECDKFSGVRKLKEIDAFGAKRLEIIYDIDLDEGNFRAVLISEGEIVQDLKIGNEQKIIIENPNTYYQIRIAGESAEVEIELEYHCISYNY